MEASIDGLTESEAKGRLKQFGFNEIVEKKQNPFFEFLRRYWGSMPRLLEVAMGLSFALKHYLEGIIIFGLLTVNAIIGHMHSRGSQKAIELLKEKLAIKAKVLRDGKWEMREAKEIVPGDIIAVKLVGLLSLADPPRPDSKSMIEEARKQGIKPLMLTGDNMAIAKEIAHQVGIGSKIIRLTDIEGLSENEQVKVIEKSDGFAEIYPEDKYKVVKPLQSKGHMVGMTGDGVDDAPALKQAEMGIAVSNSTDAAKALASVVLTEPGMSVITDAVTIIRQTYQ